MEQQGNSRKWKNTATAKNTGTEKSNWLALLKTQTFVFLLFSFLHVLKAAVSLCSRRCKVRISEISLYGNHTGLQKEAVVLSR